MIKICKIIHNVSKRIPLYFRIKVICIIYNHNITFECIFMEYSINYLRYTYTISIIFIQYIVGSITYCSKLPAVLPSKGIAWAVVIACGIAYTCIYILSHIFIHVNKTIKRHSCPMIRQLIGWSIPPSFSRENATSLCTKEASFCPVIRKRGRILEPP